MEKKLGPELTLFFLLVAALCSSEATIIEHILYIPAKTMTWTNARLYCQKNYINMVTREISSMGWLAELLVEDGIPQAWVGLHRDLENVSAWRWIDLKTGEGLSASDVSQSRFWAEGHQSGQCAFVSGEDLMWRSERCSAEHEFYCTDKDSVKHHENKLSWYEASLYCIVDKTNLAAITRANSVDVQKRGWIGLHREFGETWSWIGQESLDFTNWADGEPVSADCASVNASTALMESHACSEKLHFFCFDDNLVLVNESKTWEGALNHCRAMKSSCDSRVGCVYRYDLVSMESSDDYSYVRNRIYKATTDEVWTGLRFLGGSWWWVNGKMLDDHFELPDCPSQEKHCGTLSKYSTDNWITKDCSEKRNFVCYRREAVLGAEDIW